MTRGGRPTHWPALLTALAAGIVGGSSIGKMSPALPFVTAEFGLSLIEAGWLVSMFNVIALASAVFFGIVSDRIGAFRFCLAGLAIQAAAGVLGMAASSAPVLLVSRVLEGVGFVATVVAAPVLMAAAASDAERRLAFGLWGTYMPVGAALMIAASPPLLAAWGWRGVWAALVAAIAVCALALAAQARRYPGVKSGAQRSPASIRAGLRQPVPWLLGAAFAVYTLQFYTIMVWLPTYLLRTRGIEAAQSALLTVLFIVFNAAGNLAGARLVHRKVARGAAIATSLALTSVCFVGIFSAALPDAARYGLVLAYGFAAGVIPPMATSGMAYARAPAEAGALQGLIVQISNIGTFIGPPLVAGVVTWSGSWDAALGVVLAAAALGMTSAWGIQRLESRRPPPLPSPGETT